MVIRISQLKVEIKNLKEPNKKGFVNEEESVLFIKRYVSFCQSEVTLL